MTTVNGAWSRAQLEQFLEESRVPVRLACNHPAGGHWQVCLWYRFEDERIECATGAKATIVSFLEADPTVGFDISTNRPPYMGVRGSGEATLSTDPDKAVLRGLLDRYLGTTDGGLAGTLLADDREEVAIRIEPDRLFTWDFTQRMSDIPSNAPAMAPEPASPKDD